MMDYQEAIEVLSNQERYVGVKYVNGVEEAYFTPYFEKALDTAISAMQELQALHEQGISLERLKDIDFRKDVVEHINYYAYMKLQDELDEYKQLGTLEEVREAVEKQKEEHPRAVLGAFGGKEYECKNCGIPIDHMDDYCKWCGKKQDWE